MDSRLRGLIRAHIRNDARHGGPQQIILALICFFLVAFGEPDTGRAQVPPAKTDPSTGPPAPPKGEREQQLRDVIDKLQRSEAEQARLKSEIAGLRGDRAKLNTELLKTADAVRKAEARVAESEERLRDIVTSETALRRSLEARRDTITEVLAVIQRMGRKQPPAVLARPEDMLEAVRAAILLGFVLPEIRSEAENLVVDLNELVRLRGAEADERRRLTSERDGIAGERTRLAALVSARQGQIESSEKALTEERGRIDGLAKQGQTLKELIGKMEADSATSQRASEQAKQTVSPAQNAQELAALASNAFKDPARLQPRIAFTDARGLLNLPVSGQLTRPFGASDGFGGAERGITILAGADSIVISPSDGWILFAGPYRSYGRVLIINAGSGYTFVLTGLQHTSVEIGQFVLAGEPVGAIGANGTDAGKPELDTSRNDLIRNDLVKNDGANLHSSLYVELRKDGQPIDPSPWWAKKLSEKARG